MLTILNQEDAYSIITLANENVRIPVNPNFINKLQLYLTGKVKSGVEVIGHGPFAMRAYYSLLDYGRLVGIAQENDYRVFIRKEDDWYIEFRL